MDIVCKSREVSGVDVTGKWSKVGDNCYFFEFRVLVNGICFV